MNRRTIEQLLGERAQREQEAQFAWAMALSDEDFAKIDKRGQPYYPDDMTKEGMANDFALRLSQSMRDIEEAAILKGISKLTPDGRLIRVPTAKEIEDVEKTLGELGL